MASGEIREQSKFSWPSNILHMVNQQTLYMSKTNRRKSTLNSCWLSTCSLSNCIFLEDRGPIFRPTQYVFFLLYQHISGFHYHILSYLVNNGDLRRNRCDDVAYRTGDSTELRTSQQRCSPSTRKEWGMGWEPKNTEISWNFIPLPGQRIEN